MLDKDVWWTELVGVDIKAFVREHKHCIFKMRLQVPSNK